MTLAVNWIIGTNGRGLWSEEARKTMITSINVLLEPDGQFGELRATFDKLSWSNRKHGLIYTDPLWIQEFRKNLMSYGFSRSAAYDVDYSEQGMQGGSYVSMDFSKKFAKEWLTCTQTEVVRSMLPKDNSIPQILEVKEVHSNYPESTTFVSRDPNAGRTSYSVIRIYHRPGRVVRIGNELLLEHARKVAKQSSSEDKI